MSIIKQSASVRRQSQIYTHMYVCISKKHLNNTFVPCGVVGLKAVQPVWNIINIHFMENVHTYKHTYGRNAIRAVNMLYFSLLCY